MADVVMKFDAETAKAVKGFLELEDRTKHLADKQREMGEKSSQAANKGAVSTEKWGKELKHMVFQYGSVAAAIAVVNAAMRETEAIKAKAAEGIKGQQPGMGTLAVYSGGRAGVYDQMIRGVRQSRARGIPATEAIALQGELEGAGAAADRGLFANLYGILAKPGQMAHSVGGIQNVFGGRTGTTAQTLARVLKTASVMRETPEATAGAIVGSADKATAAGVAPDELMAAIAVLKSPTGGPAEASGQVNAYLRAVTKMGLLKRGLVGSAEYLGSLKLSPAAMARRLGKPEAAAGLVNILQNREAIRAAQAGIGEAGEGGGGYLARVRRSYLGVPENRAAEEARAATEQTAMAQEEAYGVGQLQHEAVAAGMERDALSWDPVTAWFNRRIMGGMKMIGDSAEQQTGAPDFHTSDYQMPEISLSSMTRNVGKAFRGIGRGLSIAVTINDGRQTSRNAGTE